MRPWLGWREFVNRAGLHVPVGVLMAWLLRQEQVLGTIFALYFLVYELSEDWRIRDKAYKDLCGALIGLALGAFIWRWL